MTETRATERSARRADLPYPIPTMLIPTIRW